MLADIVTKSTLDTMIPSGKNLVNTNENYRKCEERKVEGGRSMSSNSQLSTWYLKGIHNYSVTFLLPLFLAVCFLISMLGVVFLFTTFFLVSKIYVLRVFVSECNTVLIILIFLANGLHLITIGVTGVVGLGNKWWILFMHSLLAVGLLFTMAASVYYVPKYEPFVMQETEMNMWSSLSKTRLKYHSGWKYIQFNMNCCGVNSYTDWCGCKNVTEITQFKMYSLSSFSKSYEKTSENIPSLKAKSFEAKDIKTFSDQSILSDNDSKGNESMKLFFTKLQPPINHNKSLADKEHQGVNYIQKGYNIVECFIPDSCCIAKETFRFKPKKCVIGEFNDGIYNEGCLSAVQHTMRHFLDSFISICKFIMIITMLDLPLAVMMIFT